MKRLYPANISPYVLLGVLTMISLVMLLPVAESSPTIARALPNRILAAAVLTPEPTVMPDSSWTTSGPYGGLVKAMVASPDFADDQTLYAGTENGVFKSTDAGASWKPLLRTIRYSVATMTISPDYKRDQTVLVGTYGAGLWRSEDAGASWTQLSALGEQASFLAVAISPDYKRDDTILVSSDQGLYKSEDRGKSWQRIEILTTGDNVFPAVSFSPLYPIDERIWVGSDGGQLYKSSDSGETWETVVIPSIGPSSSSVRDIALSPNYGRDQTLFVAVSGLGVLRSTDDGLHWDQSNPAPSSTRVRISPNFARDQTIFASGTREGAVYMSVNGGDSWTSLAEGLSGILVETLCLSPDYARDRLIWAGSRGQGAFFLRVGTMRAWESTNQGLSAFHVSSIAVSPLLNTEGTIFAGTHYGGVFRSRDRGLTWDAVNRGLPTDNLSVSALADSPTTLTLGMLYAGGADGRIYRSSRSLISWTPVFTVPLPNEAATAVRPVVSDLDVSPTFGRDHAVFAVAGPSGLFKTTNRGLIWEPMSLPASSIPTSLALSPIYDDRALTGDAKTIFVGGKEAMLLKSRSGGASWTALEAGLPAEAQVSALALSPNYVQDRLVLAGYKGGARGLICSRDAGMTWEPVDGLPNDGVSAITFSSEFATNRTIYVGMMEHGVYRSLDGSESWSSFNGGLVEPWISALALESATEEVLFIGTRGRGVWKRSTDSSSDPTATPTATPSASPSVTPTATGSPTPTVTERPTATAMHVMRLPLIFKRYPPSWRLSGLERVPLKALAADPGNPQILYAGTSNGVFRYPYCDGAWYQTDLPSQVGAYAIAAAPSPSGHLFVSTWGAGVYRSIDGGVSWEAVNTGLDCPYVNAVAVSPNYAVDQTVYAGTDMQGVYKSTDGGLSWQPANEGLTSLEISSIMVSASDPEMLWVGTFDEGVFRSLQGGEAWTSVPIGNDVIWCLSPSDDPQRLYAGTDGGVFVSQDQGTTWTATTLRVKTYSLVVHPQDIDVVVAGTSGSGVFMTSDAGQTWKALNTGLENRIVQALAIDQSGCHSLYAGTNEGVWEWDLW